jgi:ATP-dependent Clp protease adaptor protein ClpS
METNARPAGESEARDAVREPSMYAVTLYNDDITTMEFVVELLMKIFHKQPEEAASLMMSVHENGKGVAGVYTYDIAVTKKNHADLMSAEQGFPLKISVTETSGG